MVAKDANLHVLDFIAFLSFWLVYEEPIFSLYLTKHGFTDPGGRSFNLISLAFQYNTHFSEFYDK